MFLTPKDTSSRSNKKDICQEKFKVSQGLLIIVITNIIAKMFNNIEGIWLTISKKEV